jgi:hypothetical protein
MFIHTYNSYSYFRIFSLLLLFAKVPTTDFQINAGIFSYTSNFAIYVPSQTIQGDCGVAC